MPKIGDKSGKVTEPFWETTDGEKVRLYNGDVLATLKKLPSQSVHMIVTSPPYWGLRDYGTGTWEGGDPNCKHSEPPPRPKGYVNGQGVIGQGNTNWEGRHADKKVCKCGAKRTDHQLGSEKSPDCLGWARGENCAELDWDNGCHVCRMVLVFREARRVLRDDGTLWLNYGDSYASGNSGGNVGGSIRPPGHTGDNHRMIGSSVKTGLPSGNLVGVPWRVALALQADGWILRQDIIWAKPSPMPESVKSRCTKAHEYVFLFAKKGGYFCDMEAIKEKGEPESESRYKGGFNKFTGEETQTGESLHKGLGTPKTEVNYNGTRNKRSVWKIDNEEFQQFLEWKAMNSGNKLDWWNIASESYPGAHFATFPSKLITPMIKAGTSEKGCCSECGAPWKRVIEEKTVYRERPNQYVKRQKDNKGNGNTIDLTVEGLETRTVGWEPSCECNGRFETVEIPAEALVEGIIPKGWAVGEGSHNKDHPNANKVPRSKLKEEREIQSEKRNGKTVSQRIYIPSIPLEDHPVSPCIVLDPFCGSGTTNAVCIGLGRNSIGIELSRDYLNRNAIPRITGELLARPILSGLVPGKARKPVTFGEEL